MRGNSCATLADSCAIASREVANRTLEYIAVHYFEKYAIIAFLDDVEDLPGEEGARLPEQTEQQP